jgi:3-deoxy-D-manno-octulosonic-acid transferase
MLLYKLFLFCYPRIAKLLGLFNKKAKEWSLGQNQVWEEIYSKLQQMNGPIIWIHAASYGEFEQGLPIIETIKSKYPRHCIWVTFFSPSGYKYRKNDPIVDAVTYLPFDGPENANKFIGIIKPKLIVFIKYEFWYYYLKAAKNNQIPVILASAIFRSNQIFFKWYGRWYQQMLSLFSHILVQDQASYQLLMQIGISAQVSITGDTRFDRVLKNAAQATPIEWISLLSADKKIIAGSTWEEDEKILSKATAHFTQFNWIIVPHHVDTKSIQQCKNRFPNAITLSSLLNSGTIQAKPIVLIVDCIGLLRTLYQYAFVTYVGGGFGKDGVHNVLEPAAFGIPVIWGPNDAKYIEAIGLRNDGGGLSISNEAAFVLFLNECLQANNHYQNYCQKAKDYIIQNAGATPKTMTILSPYLDSAAQ